MRKLTKLQKKLRKNNVVALCSHFSKVWSVKLHTTDQTQSFRVGVSEFENKKCAVWYADMLAIALSKIVEENCEK